MAGSYPDAAQHRMPYDTDGTVMWKTVNQFHTGDDIGGYFEAMITPPTELSASDKQELNDEDNVTWLLSGGPASLDHMFGWVFPEKRDLYGFYGYAAHSVFNALYELQSSTNSFNGIAGAWTELDDRTLHSPGGTQNWGVHQGYREWIGAYTSTGIRSLRVRIQPDNSPLAASDQAAIKAFHIYGDIADGANPDRILFVDAETGLAFTELQDWGDIPRGSVHDKEIYLLNNSATLSGSSNVISFEGLYQSSFQWYSIRDNASTSTGFSTGLTINGPIAPGGRYPASTTLTLRLSVPDSTAILGPHAARVELFTGVWS